MLIKDIFYKKLNKKKAITLLQSGLQNSDDGELFFEYTTNETIIWDDQKVKSTSHNTTSGFGLRKVNGEIISYAHSSDISDDSLSSLVTTIKSNGFNQGKWDAKPNSSTIKIEQNHIIQTLNKYNFENKIQLLQNIDSYIRRKQPNNVVSASISLSGSCSIIHILRPDEFETFEERPLMRLRVMVVLKKGERKEAGSYGYGRLNYDHIFNEDMWKKAADEAIRQSLVNLESIPAPAGSIDVVLGSGWPAVMLHEAVGHGLEGDFIRKQTSLFANKIGTKVASKEVNVFDDGTIENRIGSLKFDDEGTKSQKNLLIENGILTSYMFDRQNARLLNKKSTGNCRRESYEFSPQVRMTNTYMGAGQYSPEEIISSVKAGIYATSFGGGQVDIVSGNFVFSCTEAYKIENGKVKEPIKGATLVGNGADAMTKITMVGNNLELDQGIGTCGKGGQGVNVGIGQPTILMKNITVGGTN